MLSWITHSLSHSCQEVRPDASSREPRAWKLSRWTAGLPIHTKHFFISPFQFQLDPFTPQLLDVRCTLQTEPFHCMFWDLDDQSCARLTEICFLPNSNSCIFSCCSTLIEGVVVQPCLDRFTFVSFYKPFPFWDLYFGFESDSYTPLQNGPASIYRWNGFWYRSAGVCCSMQEQ